MLRPIKAISNLLIKGKALLKMDYVVKKREAFKGEITVASDKSISHRCVMFGSIAKGETYIENFLTGEDCISTIKCFRKLGVEVEQNNDKVKVIGRGLRDLKSPDEILDVGNSGTTIRLMSGLLSGQNFSCVMTGDASIQKRPMDRVINPLREMGAKINEGKELFAPLNITGTKLKGITYKQKVASAQVKSALILAGLYADSPTTIIEPVQSRNHTEIMLNYFGADIKVNGEEIISTPVSELYGREIIVPNDISSAAFFIVGALICENSELLLKNVGVNETRTGIIDALIKMGANIELQNVRDTFGEKVADIYVKSSDLKGITLEGDIIPRMIDEIPVFAIAALFAKGETVIKDAEELKVKETNRIKAMVTEIKKLGGAIEETNDGMIICGGNDLNGSEVLSYNDHRIAMSMAIAGLKTNGDVKILDCECINISFPNFFELLYK